MDDPRWWEPYSWPRSLVEMAIIVQAFVEERLTPEEFETLILANWSQERDARWPPGAEPAIELLFYSVDDYCEDEALRPEIENAIDADELRRVAAETLATLRRLESADPRG